ncbi:(deoxy)nucleoside triphosphate pyrophosphohydrolase [Sphingobacterium sp. LRF_L2]|uniref:(deoxy)nucleoside triphosphate pyrophosphohydrolase n=1 Tax=Sphingobacterium sp. LRF_L2 TaxID=3369421 RepID=UPI003F63F18F
MLEVTCALIEHDKKILVCQRSEQMKMPLKWEFPGGKIEAGESKETCLKREIKEELGLTIEIIAALTPVLHHYPEFTIMLHPFRCRFIDGKLLLAEHAQAAWIPAFELKQYDWAEADIPIVKEYLAL